MTTSPTTTNPEDWEAALRQCAEEAIHLIGQVQSGHALISIDVAADRFVHLSANAGSLFDSGLEALWQTPPSGLFGKAQLDLLQRRAASWKGRGPRMMEIEYPAGLIRSSWVHRTEELLVFETSADRGNPGAIVDADEWDDAVRESLAKIEKVSSLDEKLAIAVHETRVLGGFDRVMIYRFLPDGTGEVVAEEVRGDWEPYLGLRYPASDIPPQARALFAKNDMRLIRDTAAAPVPLLASPLAGGKDAVLDLSLARYRQPAAVHVEYLKNMGVTASFVTAILVEDQLWGLISAHHGEALDLPAQRQAQLSALTSHLAVDLAGLARETKLRNELASSRLANKLIQCVTLTDDWTSVLLSMAGELRATMMADGLMLRFQGKHRSHGLAPSEEVLGRILADQPGRIACSSRAGDSGIEGMPAEIGGYLIVPLSHFCDDALVFFRREETRKVTWAGSPEKTVDLSSGAPRLRPRASFEAWQEVVRGGCEEWTADDLSLAATMATTLSDIVITAHFFRQGMETPATARLRLAHESSPSPVVLADPAGVVVFLNKAAKADERFTGMQSLDRLAAGLPGLPAATAEDLLRHLVSGGIEVRHPLDSGVLEIARLTEEGQTVGYCLRLEV